MSAQVRVALLFAVLALAAFAAVGGDRPRDRVLQPLPLTELCPRLRDGRWLRAIVVQENYLHFRYHGCYYGRDANLERAWQGMP